MASSAYGHHAVDRVRDALHDHHNLALEPVKEVRVGDQIWRGLERARDELPTRPADDGPEMQVHGVEVRHDRRLSEYEVKVVARRPDFT